MLLGKIVDEVAYFVAERVLQMTMCYMEHLVESPRNVKSESVVAVGKLLAAADIFPAAPFLIGERIFHFISVGPFLTRPERGADLRELNLGDALQGVDHLLTLVLELLLVREMLPFAAATCAERLARGLATQRTRSDDTRDMSLSETVLLFIYFEVNDIAGGGIRNKHYDRRFVALAELRSGQRFPFGGDP